MDLHVRSNSVHCVVAACCALLAMSAMGHAGGLTGAAPADIGAKDGRLRPCPARPNCVCSQATDAHFVKPLSFEGTVDAAMARLKQILIAMPRTRIVEERPTYLRAQAASRLFGFVDDLEFVAEAGQGIVHVRSASRVGYSDLGVNRRRVEAIRGLFSAPASR